MYLRLLATLMIFIHHWLRLLAALMYLRLLAALMIFTIYFDWDCLPLSCI